MAHLRSNKALAWIAPAAMVGALGLAACGDSSDSDVSARTVAPAAGAVGSDVHLYNQAADIESKVSEAHLDNQVAAMAAAGSDVHLYNQAADIAGSETTSGSDVHLANLAAEAAERQAQLDGNAETYSTPQDSDDTGSTDDEFVPGSRRMPTR
jgi:hypothetical protein